MIRSWFFFTASQNFFWCCSVLDKNATWIIDSAPGNLSFRVVDAVILGAPHRIIIQDGFTKMRLVRLADGHTVDGELLEAPQRRASPPQVAFSDSVLCPA